MSGDEPKYQPELWTGKFQDTHNCYSYAMNALDPAQLKQCEGKPTGCQPFYHQPGGTKGRSKFLRYKTGRACKVVEQLMLDDNPSIQRTTFEAKCPVGSSKIALVVHPGEDYHFYRQDADGQWSHKDGANPVKRYDAEGRPIWNPKTAARDYRPHGSFLNYTDFCGFYCVPRRVTIKLARGGRRKCSGRKTIRRV